MNRIGLVLIKEPLLRMPVRFLAKPSGFGGGKLGGGISSNTFELFQ